jgi:hypothetical protein
MLLGLSITKTNFKDLLLTKRGLINGVLDY